MSGTRPFAFPTRTALTIVAAIGLLALLPYLPGKKLSGPKVQQVVSVLRLPTLFVAKPGSQPKLAATRDVEEATKAKAETPPPRVYLNVPPGSLDTFFNALHRVDEGQPGAVLRVLHYGDSPTTADSITADVRSLLQKRFGDGGHGFVLIAKPWAWYGHRGIDLEADGWEIEAASVTRAKDGIHGLGGVSFRGQAGAFSRVRLPDRRHTKAIVYYLGEPDGGSFRVQAGQQTLTEVDTAANAKELGFAEFSLPPGTREVELTVTSGSVRLFGYRFDKSGPGIQYSSLGINGGQVQMVVRFFEPKQWAETLRHENPDLVVVNYGTNESVFPDYVEREYPGELRTLISRIRSSLPNASILLMSPMDRGVKELDGSIGTPAVLHRLIDVQRQVALENGCAFFNTFEAMGGDGTMARWYAATPRLVSADFMHPMPAGAAKVGALFEEALLTAYDSQRLPIRDTKLPPDSAKPPKEAPTER